MNPNDGLRSSPEELQIRREFIVDCRRRGLIWDAVAKAVHTRFGRLISDTQCAEDFRIIMKQRQKAWHEAADACRDIALQRLDKAVEVIWDRIEAGSLDHIEMLLKIETRRAKLLGIDEQHENIDANRPRLTEEELLEKIRLVAERIKSRGLPLPNMSLPMIDVRPQVIESHVESQEK